MVRLRSTTLFGFLKGVDEEKYLSFQNGVDTNRFTPLEKDENLRSEIGLSDGLTIGYVGSFVRYEGLELLVAFVKSTKSIQMSICSSLVMEKLNLIWKIW